LQEAKEINFIKDILTKYQDAPVKAFLGKEPFAEAHTYKAKAFTDAQVGTLIEHLNHEFTTLEEVIKKVFKAFDTDNSGFIDAQELADVSKELGKGRKDLIGGIPGMVVIRQTGTLRHHEKTLRIQIGSSQVR
jgi:hypothetical protein